MSQSKTEIFKYLNQIKGNGAYVKSGVRPLTIPGLSIESVGEIGFPISEETVKKMISVAKKAPFGKGSETILDSNVRSAWEIDADQISFLNPTWQEYFAEILAKVQHGLGIEDRAVNAVLYKLLIYEEGDFFLPHQDSEKEKGMFGTLVVGLPSKHEGGSIFVRFGGEEEEVDFSVAVNNYQIPYVAFYADCEHEIKPVTAGYRVCLAYNLIQESGDNISGAPEFGVEINALSKLLKGWETDFNNKPMAVLLGHQYTPTNFSSATLKLDDAPRADVLLKAAEKAGYFGRLGLVTNHISGQLEDDGSYYNDYRRGRGRSRYRYYDDDAEEATEQGTMGEIYDESIEIKHWATDDLPSLGYLSIDENDIVKNFSLAEGDPIEQEQEGYTGNAGMSIDYWYHYGAVILWPKSMHDQILVQLAKSVQLDWIKFYVDNWEREDLAAQIFTKKLVQNFRHHTAENTSYYRNKTDFSPLAGGLAKLADTTLLKECQNTLIAVFPNIQEPQWQALLEVFDNELLIPIFEKAGQLGNKDAFNKLLHNLSYLYLSGKDKMQAFVQQQIPLIPIYLQEAKIGVKKETAYSYYDTKSNEPDQLVRSIIEGVLFFSKTNQQERSPEWVEATVNSITHKASSDFINHQLFPVLKREDIPLTGLKKALIDYCVEDLKKRTKVKPSPPINWSRAVPTGNSDAEIWKMLTPFLQSPTEKVYDYVANEGLRKNMEYAIRNVEIDLATTTITKGRPYTLRLTKTQAAYEKELKQWEEDMGLLNHEF